MGSSRPVWLALAASAGLLSASTTAVWEINSFAEFAKGRLQSLSLHQDGRLALAPHLDLLLATEQAVVWSMVEARDGSLWVATGHRGKVFRIDTAGKAELVWSAPEPEVFALAAAADGSVFAASSPDGKIYRIHHGKAEEYYSPGAKYVWRLLATEEGVLYAGTGDRGRVYRITAPGKGELYFDSGQTHITALALDPQGRLLAGSEPNGIIYRISAPHKAFALYDASLPEIRSLRVAPDGTIYAGAMGGSLTQKNLPSSPGAPASPLSGPSISVTVTEQVDQAQIGADLRPKPTVDTNKAPLMQPAATYPAVVELGGAEKSALYRINPDHTVETLWSSQEENLYDLVLWQDEVLFSTDGQGRIYRLDRNRRLTLLAQTGEGETTKLELAGAGLVAGTGTMGKVFRLTPSVARQGIYESPVHDAGAVAQWGQISWRASKCAACSLTFRTRSGNSARPDQTWSDWSDPVANPIGALTSSPNARFYQWRAEFAGDGVQSPVLTAVSVAYLPQNHTPVVRSIQVTTQQVAVAASSAVKTAANASAAYTITVTDSGESTPQTSAGSPVQTVGRSSAQQIQISWQAEDPDNDPLTYALYYRGEDENEWKLLRAGFGETSLTFDGAIFADGKYLFRVVASDKTVNALGRAREAELVSAPVLFDYTPPQVSARLLRYEGGKAELEMTASDSSSALRRAEYSADGGAWAPLAPVDGIIDGRQERFLLTLPRLSAGEHVVVFRVYDSAGNPGLAKVIVR